jgi:gamma-glutamyltranspeptidase / glutathione hydrolase
MFRKIHNAFFTVVFSLCCAGCSFHTTESPPTTAGISTGHAIATGVGEDILRRGGTAFDAAVAVHFALSACYPVAGNIGGGGFAVYTTSDGRRGCIDFRETAPQIASDSMFLSRAGEVQTDLARRSALSSGVPGSVAGMDQLHRMGGTLPWAELLKPAIALAAKGFPLTPFGADELNVHRTDFLEANDHSVAFVRADRSWTTADTLVQPELARTLQLLADSGSHVFYHGSIAALIEADQKHKGGCINREDLARYRALERTPMRLSFRDYELVTMPLPSSGGLALGQLLRGADDLDWKKWPVSSSDYVHHIAELARRVYADRSVYPGDPDFVDVPLDRLLDSAYNAERFATINPNRATPSQEVLPGRVDRIESFQTTHYSIVDRWGNAVVVTTTLNSYFGSGVVVQGAGFLMNNEMDDFSLAPGVSNQFGLIGGEANAIAPGKRMLSSMTPTLVFRNDSLHALLGTPGGSTIITNVLQVFLQMAVYERSLEEAVVTRKMHAQWMPDEVYLEGTLYNDTTLRLALERLGHQVRYVDRIGMFCGIQKQPNGSWKAVADTTRKGDGKAMDF